MDIKKRVEKLRRAIEKAAIKYRLNLTIYDGKLGFVDQEQKKIVALWNSNYKLEEERNEGK